MTMPSHVRGCVGCRFFEPTGPFCVYILATGHPRPCKPKPNGGCDVKDTKTPKKRVKPLPDAPCCGLEDKSGDPLEGNAVAEKMYAAGASDAVIAKACHTSKSKVFRWRQATGRPSNQKKKGDNLL